MSIHQARETVNLAELNGEELMAWEAPDGRSAPVRSDRRRRAFSAPRAPTDVHTPPVSASSSTRASCTSPAAPGRESLDTSRAIRPAPLSLRLDGIDLVLEGSAERVRDRSTLEQVASVYRAGGCPAERDGDALTAPFSAQSAGPPPWYLYRVDVRVAFGVGLREPHGASRWRF